MFVKAPFDAMDAALQAEIEQETKQLLYHKLCQTAHGTSTMSVFGYAPEKHCCCKIPNKTSSCSFDSVSILGSLRY